MATKSRKRTKRIEDMRSSESPSLLIFSAFLCLLWLTTFIARGEDAANIKLKSLADVTARLAKETSAAYDACQFCVLSKDYFNRFSRDASAEPCEDETAIDSRWRILLRDDAKPLGRLMATHLQSFLRDRMGVNLPIEA